MQMTQQRSEYCMTTNSVKFMQRMTSSNVIVTFAPVRSIYCSLSASQISTKITVRSQKRLYLVEIQARRLLFNSVITLCINDSPYATS